MSQLDFSRSLYKYLGLKKRKLSPRKFKRQPKVISWWGHHHHVPMFLGFLSIIPPSEIEFFNVYWRNPWTEVNETVILFPSYIFLFWVLSCFCSIKIFYHLVSFLFLSFNILNFKCIKIHCFLTCHSQIVVSMKLQVYQHYD